MKIEKEQIEQVINFGVFGYSAKKIASILGEDEQVIHDQMQDKNSHLSKLLQKGKDTSDYVIDLKLFEMAKGGDIKALDKLNQRKRINP